MEMTIFIIAFIISLSGLLGCFLPVIPGPPLSYAALLIAYFFTDDRIGLTPQELIIWGIVTLAVTVADYLIPAYFTKTTGGSVTGAKGALIGMLAGIFLIPPVGMLGGSLLGAFLAEKLIARQSTAVALKAAFGSFIGFIVGTGIKLAASIMMMLKLFQFC